MAEKVTVSLEYPITVGGVEAKSLALRRPKVRDVVAVNKSCDSDAERELKLIANLAELAPDELEEMDVKDYAKLQAQLKVFFGRE
ncbi:phage tail assembly protein [Pyramidobacter porci]